MKFLTLLVTFFFCSQLTAQNLLANGGFEDVNTCTEYDVECAPEAWISSLNAVINFFKDPNRAHAGQNCMSVEAGHDRKPYNRTFIRSRLLCGLRKGNQYRVEFFIKSQHTLFDSVGILFSSTDPLLSTVPFTKLAPSVYLKNITGLPDIRDSNWYKIETDFIATGLENYITIGYFGRKDFKGTKVNSMEDRFFFFIDDIKLIPLDPKESICRGWENVKKDIYEENERHEWLDRLLKHRRLNPPDPPVILKTSYVRIDTLVMPDILFASGRAILDPASFPLLDSISRRIKGSQVDSVIIEGHTDSTGSIDLNQQLSIDRAEAVKKYLFERTANLNILARGWAFLKPVADNRTIGGRQKNRRVEVILYTHE
jgi:outer membrane protein OmpA-like peptidoglycan-associated protein